MQSRRIGVDARGIRTPMLQEGDNIVDIVVESVIGASEVEGFEIRDRDVLGITESLVARTQGNMIKISDVTAEIEEKYPGESIGVVFPIMSRNRFEHILKGIAATGKKVYVLLDMPCDEVGNHIVDLGELYKSGVNPYRDILTKEGYYETFKKTKHIFTGVDYVDLYSKVGENIEVIVSKNLDALVGKTDQVLVSNVHEREKTKEILREKGMRVIYDLGDLNRESREGRGYNREYGLMGSNLSKDGWIKLFPRDSKEVVEGIKEKVREETGKEIEVMVYGDGAFKDPVGKIWELADPVVAPAYTKGLEGTPDEIKLKYIVDNEMGKMSQEEFKEYLGKREKEEKDKQGTTPRQLTDLLGSLMDLVSGSGDKGTPVVLVQGYFDKYTDNY